MLQRLKDSLRQKFKTSFCLTRIKQMTWMELSGFSVKYQPQIQLVIASSSSSKMSCRLRSVSCAHTANETTNHPLTPRSDRREFILRLSICLRQWKEARRNLNIYFLHSISRNCFQSLSSSTPLALISTRMQSSCSLSLSLPHSLYSFHNKSTWQGMSLKCKYLNSISLSHSLTCQRGEGAFRA